MEKGEAIREELKKIGIFTEAQLNEAIRNLPPLNLYIMTSKATAGRKVS